MSLIELPADTPAATDAPPSADTPAVTPPPEAAPPVGRTVEYNGEKIEVPEQFWDVKTNAPNIGALAKSAVDLRRQLSERPKAPETYELTVPEAFKDKVKPNAEDPRWTKVQEWGKKHNVPQEAVNDLLAVEFEIQAGAVGQSEEFTRTESAALDQALGANAAQEKQAIGRWVGGLLGQDMQANPALRQELEFLATTASGVLLLKTLKDKLNEKNIPGAHGGGGNDGGTVTEAGLRALQASDAYRRGDPETVRKVSEGYKRLYPD